MENIKKMGTENIFKLLMELSIPAIIASLVFALYNIVDRIFIGKGLGAFAMTGVSITFPIFMIYIAIGMLIGQGGGALASIKLGEGKKDEADKILGNSLMLFFIMSILILIFGTLFMDKLLVLFGATENTIVYAKPYLRIINSIQFFGFTAMGLNSFIRSEGNAKIAMFSMVLGAVINIILDPLFIFVFKMGIAGAAYATAVGNVISGIFIIYHFTKSKKSILKLSFESLKPDFKLIAAMLTIGVSPFSLQIATSLVNAIANNTLLEYGGDLAIGAMGIITTIQMMVMIILQGINAGSQPILGYNYGAKQYDRVKQTLFMAIIISMLLAFGLFLVIMIFPKFFINLFNKGNIELANIGIHGIKIYLSTIVFNAFYIIGANYFQAINQPMKSMVLNLSRQLVLFIPALLIFPNYMGLDGVWFAGPFADIIISVITFAFIFKNIKKLDESSLNVNLT